MTMRVRMVLMLMVGLAMMGLASCDHYNCNSGATFGSSSCTTTTIGNGSGTVFAYLLSESNSVSMTADSLNLATNAFAADTSFVAPGLPSTLVSDGGTVVVNQKYLYIAFRNGTVYGYTINGSTGALTSMSGNPYTLSTGTSGTSIASDPAGRFLFVSDSVTGDISAFTISATDGSLTAVAGSPFASGISAAQMTTDGKGLFLYVTTGTSSGPIVAFTISQSGTLGALSSVSGSPFAFGMSKVLGENTGKYLFGIDGQTADISVFSIASNGVIAQLGSPVATASVPVNFAVHPTGTFVYAFEGLSTPVEGYTFSGGALAKMTNSPFTGVSVDAGQFDQSGLFLLGVGEGSSNPAFAAYATNVSTGVISPTTFAFLPFPSGSFAVTDLTTAP